MANGGQSQGGFSPLWYAVGALILIALMMGTILMLKPLEFKPVATTGEGPPATSQEAPAPEHHE
ncbi:MAG TPA: hypothetical protein VNU97_02040 [Rhizomicrobium sp.]|jgi:hypothetical protein|nr:hypothetical protein [Rhizomicrobium sp.]